MVVGRLGLEVGIVRSDINPGGVNQQHIKAVGPDPADQIFEAAVMQDYSVGEKISGRGESRT